MNPSESITYEVTNKRIKEKKWGYVNKYKFANKQEDTETDLQYFEKRYYDNRIGRFTTEDPVFWEVGLTKRPWQYFTDPQQWNTYSYVKNSPLIYTDPTGECFGDDSMNCLDRYKQDVADAINSDSWFLRWTGYVAQQNIVEPTESTIDDWKEALKWDKKAIARLAFTAVSNTPVGKWAKWISAVVKTTKIFDANRINHIFWKTAHNLWKLLDTFWGDSQKALREATDAANKALADWKLIIWKDGVLPKEGIILNVWGVDVRMIGGVVKDGKVEISSLSRQWLQ